MSDIVHRRGRTAPARSSRAEAHTSARREMLTRIRLVASASLVAAGVWLIARWLTAQFAFSGGSAGVATFCAVWVALYPLARRNRALPGWMHWARGGFVLIVFWLFSLFAK